VADGEELPDVAAGDGAAAEARAADDGEARGGELDQGLELGGLLGGALAEEAHGCCLRTVVFGWCAVAAKWWCPVSSSPPPTLYTGRGIGALWRRNLTCL